MAQRYSPGEQNKTGVDWLTDDLLSMVEFEVIPYSVTGKPTASVIVKQYVVVQPFTLKAGLSGSYATAQVAATASTVFTLKKISSGVTTTIGTITFAIAGTVGAFVLAADVGFGVGDILSITSPAQDATLADIVVGIRGILAGGQAVAGNAPIVTVLTDGATIATNCNFGLYSCFRVTLGGNRTLQNPTNAADGQILLYEIIQDSSGSRGLTLDSKFHFGSVLTSIALSTVAGARDHLGVQYNAGADKFDIIAFEAGY